MIEKPTLAGVAFVAANMRAADAEEIWPLRFDKTPEGLARTVMSDPAYVWLATAGEPVAAFGMFEVRPKAWTAFAFATDNFNKVSLEITRFLVKVVKSHLFQDLGAQRVEAWSHGNHAQAHRWLTALGASPEPDPEYGPEGEPYVRFVMRRSAWLLSRAEKTPTLFASGRIPNLASSDDFSTAAHVHP